MSRNDTTANKNDQYFSGLVQLLTLTAVVVALIIAASCIGIVIMQRMKERNRIQIEQERLIQELAHNRPPSAPQVMLENVETQQRIDLLHEGPPIETPPYSPRSGESRFVQPGENARERRFSSGSSSSSGHHLMADGSIETELKESDASKLKRPPPNYVPPPSSTRPPRSPFSR